MIFLNEKSFETKKFYVIDLNYFRLLIRIVI
jgi:hypothetical protein